MKRQEILDRINEIIVDERGRPVTMNGMFMDSELDSLGVAITLLTIDGDFNLQKSDDPKDDIFESLDIKELKVKDLVNLCKLSITNTSTAQK